MAQTCQLWTTEADPPLFIRKKADVVIFTDGFSPDPREKDRRPDRIGAIMFDRRMISPVQFTARVPDA